MRALYFSMDSLLRVVSWADTDDIATKRDNAIALQTFMCLFSVLLAKRFWAKLFVIFNFIMFFSPNCFLRNRNSGAVEMAPRFLFSL
jgi:hypothetical protein